MVFLVAVTSRPPAVRIVDGFLESKVGAGEAAAEDDKVVAVKHVK